MSVSISSGEDASVSGDSYRSAIGQHNWRAIFSKTDRPRGPWSPTPNSRVSSNPYLPESEVWLFVGACKPKGFGPPLPIGPGCGLVPDAVQADAVGRIEQQRHDIRPTDVAEPTGYCCAFVKCGYRVGQDV